MAALVQVRAKTTTGPRRLDQMKFADGTTPANRDALTRRYRNGTSSLEHSVRNHVGIGSEAHCLFGGARTAAATSSCVTCLKLEITQSVDAKLGVAVLEIDARISETFLSKKLRKSPALTSSLPCDRPRRLAQVACRWTATFALAWTAAP